MAETALLVGSVPLDVSVAFNLSIQSIEGNFYLRHSTAALSLLQEMVDAMTAAGVAAPTATIRENLRVRLTSSGAFTVTWNSTQLRDILGYTGNLGSGTTHDAPNPSPLLWAPGYPATPKTRTSKQGYIVPHVTFHAADDGSSVQTQHYGSERWQELKWRTLLTSRMQVPDGDDTGNTLEGLYENVLQYGYRFMYHQSVVTDFAGTDAIDWNDAEAFGPYQLRKPIDPSWYERIIQNADSYAGPLELEMKRVEEYA